MIILRLALLSFAWAGARVAPAAPAVVVSTGAVAPKEPSDLYTAGALRDPFRPSAAGRGGAAEIPFSPETFSIHNLTLRGSMGDRGTGYALLTDNTYDTRFLLRRGRLYDPKGHPIPGIKGQVDAKRKRVYLKTADGDVQVFPMGEKSQE